METTSDKKPLTRPTHSYDTIDGHGKNSKSEASAAYYSIPEIVSNVATSSSQKGGYDEAEPADGLYHNKSAIRR